MEQLYTAALASANAGKVAAAHAELAALLIEIPVTNTELNARVLLLSAICSLAKFDNPRALEQLRNAQSLFAQLGQAEDESYCELLGVRVLIDNGEIGRARYKAQKILELAVSHGWTSCEALARALLGTAYFHLRQHEQARRELEQALALENRYRLDWEPDFLKLTLAGCLGGLGLQEEAQRLYAESNSALEPLAVPRATITRLTNEAYQAMMAQDYVRARDCYVQMVQESTLEGLSEDLGAWYRATARYNLGIVQMELGNFSEAKRQLLRAWDKLHELNREQLACSCLSSLSIIALLENNPEDAVHYARTSKQAVTVFDDIESQVIDYYLAIAYLGAGSPYDASYVWEQKAALEINAETQQLLDWMQRELDHLLAPEYAQSVELSASARELARQWKQELAALAGAE